MNALIAIAFEHHILLWFYDEWELFAINTGYVVTTCMRIDKLHAK